jgi:hypothetical protein
VMVWQRVAGEATGAIGRLGETLNGGSRRFWAILGNRWGTRTSVLRHKSLCISPEVDYARILRFSPAHM